MTVGERFDHIGLRKRSPGTDPVLLVLLGASLALNVLLGLQWRSQAGTPALRTELAPGTHVPSIEAENLRGEKEVIQVEGVDQNTLVYAFTTECPWCKRNVESINVLKQQLSGRLRVVGLVLNRGPVETYIQQHGLQIPVYQNPSRQSIQAYKLGVVPNTILVARNGRVLAEWAGAYVGGVRAEIEGRFGLRLPDIAPPQVTSATSHAQLPLTQHR